MIIGWLFDALVLLSMLLWLLRLGLNGTLSPEIIALLLVAAVVLVAIARAAGMGLVRLTLRVGVPLVSLWLFITANTDGSREEITAALAAIVALLMAVFGIYIMIAGVLQSRRRRQR